MKKHPINRSKPSALDDALVSIAIVANNPATQQAITLLALMTFALLREVPSL